MEGRFHHIAMVEEELDNLLNISSDLFSTVASVEVQQKRQRRGATGVPPRSTAVVSMIDIPSGRQASTTTRSRGTAPTPCDSLKQLVHSKSTPAIASSSNSLCSQSNANKTTTQHKRASIVETPSTLLRRVVFNQFQQDQCPPPISESLLHRVCCQPDMRLDDIDHILQLDPFAASRSIQIFKTPQVTRLFPMKETYTFPLHLAIQHGASNAILERLVDADPCILMQQDGRQLTTPIMALLKYQPHSIESLYMMILKSPSSVTILDRHANTALHVACAHGGACLDAIRALVGFAPQALRYRNFHGQTPLNVAQAKSATVGDDVFNYLFDEQERFIQERERRLYSTDVSAMNEA